MRITESQLRRIVREEAQALTKGNRRKINETAGDSAEYPRLLAQALVPLYKAKAIDDQLVSSGEKEEKYYELHEAIEELEYMLAIFVSNGYSEKARQMVPRLAGM